MHLYTHIHSYIHTSDDDGQSDGDVGNKEKHTYIHTHTHIHTYIHTCIHTYKHACMHACACMHTYAHAYIHTSDDDSQSDDDVGKQSNLDKKIQAVLRSGKRNTLMHEEGDTAKASDHGKTRRTDRSSLDVDDYDDGGGAGSLSKRRHGDSTRVENSGKRISGRGVDDDDHGKEKKKSSKRLGRNGVRDDDDDGNEKKKKHSGDRDAVTAMDSMIHAAIRRGKFHDSDSKRAKKSAHNDDDDVHDMRRQSAGSRGANNVEMRDLSRGGVLTRDHNRGLDRDASVPDDDDDDDG
jgi:hypothetical protein